jgi:dCMP deaminase
VLHAEMNAISKVSGSTESSDNATMFCTHAPCIHCAKAIFQSGIKNLYYRDTYRDQKGLEFLEKGGIVVNKFNDLT